MSGARRFSAAAPYGKDHHARSGRGRRRSPRRGASRILEDNGYTTDVVHDGEAGVQYGEAGTYDVIILDVMLPKADGFTVAQRLRRAHVSTPILLLTARDAISDKICGYDSGRRRLHDQALLPRRAAGPLARPHAAARAMSSSRRSPWAISR